MWPDEFNVVCVCVQKRKSSSTCQLPLTIQASIGNKELCLLLGSKARTCPLIAWDDSNLYSGSSDPIVLTIATLRLMSLICFPLYALSPSLLSKFLSFFCSIYFKWTSRCQLILVISSINVSSHSTELMLEFGACIGVLSPSHTRWQSSTVKCANLLNVLRHTV